MGFVSEFEVRVEGWSNPRTVYAHSDGSEISLQVKICECKTCDEMSSAIRETLSHKDGLRWEFHYSWIHAITLFDTSIKAGEEQERQFKESIEGEAQHPIRGRVNSAEFRQKVVEYLSRVLEMKMELVDPR